MRVMLVTKPLSPPWNDSGKLVPRAMVMGSSGRHPLQVLVTDDATGTWPAHVTPVPVYRDRGRYRPGAAAHLRMMHGVWRRRARFDLLHFFFQPHPAATRAARLLARACGRPAVHTVLSAPLQASPDLLFAERTVTLTHSTARAFAAVGGHTHAVVPPALEDLARADPARIAAARRDVRLEGPFMIYPGDFELSGGHELLLDVWCGAAELPTLLLTGRAKTPRAATARAGLEDEVMRRNLRGRVVFADTVQDMPALVAGAEALLFPARSLYAKTDLPLVVLEAWRECRPVIASDLPPLVESVGEAGLTLPLEAGVWRDALRSLPVRGAALGVAGRERFEVRGSARAAAIAYEALYDDACTPTSTSGRTA